MNKIELQNHVAVQDYINRTNAMVLDALYPTEEEIMLVENDDKLSECCGAIIIEETGRCYNCGESC